MRIAFLTGGLEAGRDGVGDYCRLLALELVRQGHEVALLALNDAFVQTETREDTASPQGPIPVLRQPALAGWAQKMQAARHFLDGFSPDWISLQFVAYGWQKKGVVIAVERHLRALLSGRRLHLNFHEIWIGAHLRASRKDRVIGSVQRWSIVRLVRRLAPRLVTTTNGVYQALLERVGIAASRLPLFGNVPVLREEQGAGWPQPLAKLLETDTIPSRESVWLLGFFGTIHPGWNPRPLFEALFAVREKTSSPVYILSLGRLGGGDEPWEALVTGFGSFRFLKLGEQPAELVSSILENLDAGLSSMPLQLIEKSGSAAAMLERGVPVILSREEGYGLGARERPADPLLLWADEELPGRLARRAISRTSVWRLPAVAAEFTSSLQVRA